jgi:hypothetical protein
MIDLDERLRETEQAIEVLRQAGLQVPDEAIEIREILMRAKLAERGVEVYRNGHGAELQERLGLGRKAFETYAKQSSGRSLVSGELLPAWAELPEAIRDAWCAAALEIAKQVLQNLE